MDEFMILLNCNISGGESFDYNYYELLMKYIIISPRILSLFQNNKYIIITIVVVVDVVLITIG
jgi:hypothetical protein